MKYTFLILILLVFLVACQKEPAKPIKDPYYQINEPHTHILEGYFVEDIIFDQNGVTWINTFFEDVIKYKSGIIEIFNSNNSPISGEIWDIQTDSKGNLWIGCSDGLIKYDGETFTRFDTSNSPIPEDVIWSIAIDDNDVVWFSSSRANKGGLVKYDGTNWAVYTPENSDLPGNHITSVVFDKNKDLWLLVEDHGYYFTKISGDNWMIYDEEDIGFPIIFENGELCFNSKNELYSAPNYKLVEWEIPNPVLFLLEYNGIQFDSINVTVPCEYEYPNTCPLPHGHIYIDFEDNVWIGLSDKTYGVYNGKNWSFSQNQLVGNVMTFAQPNSSEIWIGTEDGIYIAGTEQ
ncbi:MAG TPA: two-component regulator propeller domain-containing protein [Draconibacterium sp.]|nr:two-component regulator propeller domain-containing protein [Draconibacterium sp.]